MVEHLVVSARSHVVEAADILVDANPAAPGHAHPFADMPTLDELERRYLVYALQRYLKRGFVLRRSAERERSIASLILLAMLLGLYFASIWMGLTVPNWVWQIQMWFPFWV